MNNLAVPCLLCLVLFVAHAHSQDGKPSIPESFVGKWQDQKNKDHYVVITRESISLHRGAGEFTEVVPAAACRITGDAISFEVRSVVGTIDQRTGKVGAGSAHATMIREGDTLVIRETPVQGMSGLPGGFAVTALPKLHVFHKK